MLRQVAEGVLIHESEFCQSNAVVVQGRGGVLLIDPGVLGSEMADLANDLRELGQPVAAGFSTHPHWDHLLWHADLGAPPRYGTARCAARTAAPEPHPKGRARRDARLTLGARHNAMRKRPAQPGTTGWAGRFHLSACVRIQSPRSLRNRLVYSSGVVLEIELQVGDA